MRTQSAGPKGLVLFEHSLKSALALPDESAAHVIKAAARYFLEGAEPEDFDCAEQIVFNLMREDIDNTTKKYREICERNRKIANTRCSSQNAPSQDAPADNAPSQDAVTTRDDSSQGAVTTRDDSHLIEKNRKEKEKNIKEQNKKEKEREEKEKKKTESTAARPPARAFGEYGWVKLTDEEHKKLLSALGREELERCIQYVDESAQQTGNKNKWRDWNLVLRKCSREGWGRRAHHDTGGNPANAEKGAGKRFAFRYDVG